MPSSPTPILTDAELAALIAGDRGMWALFVPRAAAVMRAPIRRLLTRHPDDIGDVLQDCFLKLVAKDFSLLRRYDPARGSLSTWLGVIATSAALDHLRKKPPLAESVEDHAETLAGEERDRTAPLELPPGLLSPRQALVLKLLYEDEREVPEVATLLGIGAASVRSLHHKAVTRLREFFRERGGYE
ncbi:MAG TPA: sigma-70 family RNA polymerase sigma factor [Gammaproteobacteria bacterium]|jgi:RNA polymerase sigma-70 factor (ECF subfamily)